MVAGHQACARAGSLVSESADPPIGGHPPIVCRLHRKRYGPCSRSRGIEGYDVRAGSKHAREVETQLWKATQVQQR